MTNGRAWPGFTVTGWTNSVLMHEKGQQSISSVPVYLNVNMFLCN